jgi:hypothetical protein
MAGRLGSFTLFRAYADSGPVVVNEELSVNTVAAQWWTGVEGTVEEMRPLGGLREFAPGTQYA